METTTRREILELLCGNRTVRLSSYGCGSRTQLAYRAGQTLFDSKGTRLEGEPCDDMLLATARMVRDRLSELLS